MTLRTFYFIMLAILTVLIIVNFITLAKTRRLNKVLRGEITLLQEFNERWRQIEKDDPGRAGPG